LTKKINAHDSACLEKQASNYGGEVVPHISKAITVAKQKIYSNI